ncbi:MAG: aminopeptidase [Candidatus Delongbacteria bacterium]|nr:aminopeptidase [Candidatus Delongbacteria bacterium]MBN2834167.1 aminopeptidase [Candidatus Delongbacteria bacterium]
MEDLLKKIYTRIDVSEIENILYQIKETRIDQPGIIELYEYLENVLKIHKDMSEIGYNESSLDKLLDDNKKIFYQKYDDLYCSSYSNPDMYRIEYLYKDQLFGAFLNKVNSFLSFIIYENNSYGLKLIYSEIYSFLISNQNEDSFKTFMINCSEYISEISVLRNYVHEQNRIGYVVKEIEENVGGIFSYGVAINDNDLKSYKHFNSISEERLNTLAQSIVKAFINGFKPGKKDISKKEYVHISYYVGQEKLVKKIGEVLTSYNLKLILLRPLSSGDSKQLMTDHSNDFVLFGDEDFFSKTLESNDQTNEKVGDYINKNAGIIVIRNFGEKPFEPKLKDKRVKNIKERTDLRNKYTAKGSILFERFDKDKNKSFTIISFPTEEIGVNFEEIFESIIEINSLDSDRYQRIQSNIIDILDKGSKVIVKGIDGNETDLSISLKKLQNPKNETNFVNCGADLNIPVGEVFTSPVLNGTNGVLHVTSVYLKGYLFKNLKIKFDNGEIAEYSCSNFEDTEKNKQYIEENLLNGNERLPLGEFAIGTNTLAHKVIEKYNLSQIVPILIFEKTGPHFAIGDTCFSRSEEKPYFNPDNREVVAKHNERSILKLEDPMKAYTNVHVDITLPFHEIEYIRAVDENGVEFSVIEKGRFAVDGTEELNSYLDLDF